jgi:hypothetical protein
VAPVSEKQIAAILALPPPQRYDHFADALERQMFLINQAARVFRATEYDEPKGYDAWAIKRGEQPPPRRQLRFVWKMGRKTHGDLIWTDGSEILVTSRFLQAIADQPGWKSFPVQLTLPSGDIEEVHSLVITGRVGAFLQHKTTKLPAGPDRAWDMYKGLCFEGTTGIAMPKADLGHVFVSQSFLDAARALALDDVTFTPCENALSQPDVYLSIVEKTVGYGRR